MIFRKGVYGIDIKQRFHYYHHTKTLDAFVERVSGIFFFPHISKLFIQGGGHQGIHIVNPATFPTKALTNNMNVLMTSSLDNNLPRKTPIYVFIKEQKL